MARLRSREQNGNGCQGLGEEERMMLVKGPGVSGTQDGQRPDVQLVLGLGRQFNSRRARAKTWAQALNLPNVFPLNLTWEMRIILSIAELL